MLRTNYNYGTSDAPIKMAPESSSAQQYELLLEFDLKRQREKNTILQQRLKNKEIFIQQMKHFQEDLTVAYEQCKNQLILAQEKIEYLQNVEFREYTEQIADLKHMLVLKTQQSKRNSMSRDEKQFASGNSKVVKNKSERGLNFKNSSRRESKSNSNYATFRERSPGGKFQLQVSRKLKSSANFIEHFLQMSEFYLSGLKSESNLTKKLKKSWKWVKDVVKEWEDLKQTNKSVENIKQQLIQAFGADTNACWKDIMPQIKEEFNHK